MKSLIAGALLLVLSSVAGAQTVPPLTTKYVAFAGAQTGKDEINLVLGDSLVESKRSTTPPLTTQYVVFGGGSYRTDNNTAGMDFGAAYELGGNVYAAVGTSSSANNLTALAKTFFLPRISDWIVAGPLLGAGADQVDYTSPDINPTTYFVGAVGGVLAVKPLDWKIGFYGSVEHLFTVGGDNLYVDGSQYRVGVFIPVGN